MTGLTKAQKKIIIISLGVLFFLIFIWIFIYLPQSKKVNSIEKELNSAEAKIAEIINIAEGNDLAEIVKDFRIKLDSLRSQLPGRDEIIIEAITTAARGLNLKVENIFFSDRQASERQVSGLKIEEIPISMKIVSEYRNFGQFLNLLRSNFPILIKFKKLDISGREGPPSIVNISLDLAAYLSKEN